MKKVEDSKENKLEELKALTTNMNVLVEKVVDLLKPFSCVGAHLVFFFCYLFSTCCLFFVLGLGLLVFVTLFCRDL